jgi:hypothetical protein
MQPATYHACTAPPSHLHHCCTPQGALRAALSQQGGTARMALDNLADLQAGATSRLLADLGLVAFPLAALPAASGSGASTSAAPLVYSYERPHLTMASLQELLYR